MALEKEIPHTEKGALYYNLSHAIENTANQKASNPLHILRYATGSIPRKNPGVPRGLQRLLYIQ